MSPLAIARGVRSDPKYNKLPPVAASKTPNAETVPQAAVADGKVMLDPFVFVPLVLAGKFVTLLVTATLLYPVLLVLISVPPPVSEGAAVKRAKCTVVGAV